VSATVPGSLGTGDSGDTAYTGDSPDTGGTGEAGVLAEVVLAEIRASALSVDEVLDAVRHPRAGGIATFVGVVRKGDHGRDVEALDYTSHPSAALVLRDLAGRLAAERDVIRLAVVHRVGHLQIGDTAVVVAVSAVHRAAALDVCRELIDSVKGSVPIWKHQIFEDGSDEWVGMP
jgi:molybdopterin synthase catalytic subunit